MIKFTKNILDSSVYLFIFTNETTFGFNFFKIFSNKILFKQKIAKFYKLIFFNSDVSNILYNHMNLIRNRVKGHFNFHEMFALKLNA